MIEQPFIAYQKIACSLNICIGLNRAFSREELSMVQEVGDSQD